MTTRQSILPRTTLSCIAITTMLCTPASGQSNILPLDTRNPIFQEQFDEDPKVNDGAQTLVGAKWLGPRVAFDPSGIAVHLPPQLRGAKACVSIVSEDGRYHAENLYDIPADADETSRFAVGTPKFRLSSRYTNEAIAVWARLVNDCYSGVSGSLLPVMLGVPPVPQVERPRRLVAQLQGEPNQLTVRLLNRGQEVAPPASCTTRPEAVKIAYTSTCVIGIPDSLLTGRYDLEVVYRLRFESSRTVYPIIVN